jgi:hypothetical protein
MATKNDAQPIIYVTRDIERAIGIAPGRTTFGDYFIIANTTPFAEEIRKKYPDHVFLIEPATEGAGGDLLDTYDLLQHVEKTIAGKIDTSTQLNIIVFKNTSRIEEYCTQKNWNLLNPAATLAEKIENKITQAQWLGDKYLLPHQIAKVSDISFPAPFMLQWAHSHTGDGTIFIPAGAAGEKIMSGLRNMFPDREARATHYVKGPVFTVNICVGMDQSNIQVGNISYQITGVLPFTENAWSTVGNDWSVTHSILTEEKIICMNEIARGIGERMCTDGWRGLFGIDCIYDEERDDIHLIEINARQPASTTYESELQKNVYERSSGHADANRMTLFEAHFAAMLGKKTENIIEINDGAQIIERVTSAKINPEKIQEAAQTLREKSYMIIEYPNTKIGADLMRIQSLRGIMESHGKFNARGKEILEIVSQMMVV